MPKKKCIVCFNPLYDGKKSRYCNSICRNADYTKVYMPKPNKATIKNKPRARF